MSAEIDALKAACDDYRDHLIGLTIYYQLIPKALRWTNTGSFNRIKGRTKTALSEANELINKYEAGMDVAQAIRSFSWPVKWSPMVQRADTCLQAYNMIKASIGSDYENLGKPAIRLLREMTS